MRRRKFIKLLGGSALAWPLAARAQQSDRMRRVGILVAEALEGDPYYEARLVAIREKLRALGWIEGQNLKLDIHRAAPNAVDIRKHADELLAGRPDIVVTSGGTTTGPMLQATNTVPVVFMAAVDPVGAGLVESLSHPGGNATGFMQFDYSLSGKWLEILKQVAPRVRRVALVFNPQTAPFAELFVRPIQAAASSFAIMPVSMGAGSFTEIESMVDAFAREPDGSLMVLPDLSAFNYREAVVALAARHRQPAVYPFRVFVASGGLLSYGTDVSDVFRRAAAYVDRILKGEKPADLPVQAPTKYELVINLKTAKAIGLEVPATVLVRADEVIE